MKIILTQTDTTVGFISQDKQKLQEIKQRDGAKPFIIVYQDLKTLTSNGHRVPNRFKNNLRRSNKTTYIVKNRAFRVAKSSLNSQILRDTLWHYSTSANAKGKKYHFEFCENIADVIIQDKDGLRETSSSTLLKINNLKKVRIR